MNTIQFSRSPRYDKAARIFMAVVGGFFMMVIFALIFGFLLKFLWNATMTELFAMPAINYWQAIGLFVLAKFCFGFGHGGTFQHQYHKKHHEQWQRWYGQKPGDSKEPADDEMLQKYWEEHGKEAYAAYLAARDKGQADNPAE